MTVSQNNQQNALPNVLGGVSLQTEDRYTFTGKELDAESNIYYYDARYNSSTYSQFTSPDPMSDKYPSVSPYLYCAGNPIMYVDPTGMVIAIEDGGEIYLLSGNPGSYGFYCGEKRLNNDFANKVTDALNKIGKGFWGYVLINALNENDKTVLIQYSKGKNYFSNDRMIVHWNPEKRQGGLNVKGNTYCPSFVGLIHEMAHATSEMYGFSDYSTWVILSNGKNVKNDEKWATYVENLVRGEQNVPYRKYYAHYDDAIFHSGVPETLICEQSRTNSGFVSLYSMDIKMNELMKLLWTSCGRYGY